MHRGTGSKLEHHPQKAQKQQGTKLLIWTLGAIVFVIGYWVLLMYYFSFTHGILRIFATVFRDWMLKAQYESSSMWYWLTVWVSGSILVLPLSIGIATLAYKLFKKKWLITVLLVFTLIQGFDFYFKSETYFYGYPSIDTFYTEEYTSEKWQIITEGMSKEEVITLLGQPFEVGQEASPNCTSQFLYSRDGKAGPHLDFAWNAAYVCFNENDRVSAKAQEFRFD